MNHEDTMAQRVHKEIIQEQLYSTMIQVNRLLLLLILKTYTTSLFVHLPVFVTLWFKKIYSFLKVWNKTPNP
ncbi:hypothetical protein BUE76_08275 [Cnuella takakiae]|nr:hypothetical protein BUE76_08275 [Cnuella takakiae]